MDEGLIYEEGTPQQIFENPQKEKTRAFINRVRSFNYRISSPDYDLYAMNAEIEAFCEKQILPRKTRQNLLLLVEELLQIYNPFLRTTLLDMTLAYSEKKESLELVCETAGEAANPLDKKLLSDELGLAIINSLAEGIDYQRVNNKNRLTLMMKRS